MIRNSPDGQPQRLSRALAGAALTLGLLLASPHSHAGAYLLVDGIRGPQKDGSFELYRLDYERAQTAAGTPVGAPLVTAVKVWLPLNATTGELVSVLGTGRRIPAARIEQRSNSPDHTLLLTIEMRDVLIAAANNSVDAAPPSAQLTLMPSRSAFTGSPACQRALAAFARGDQSAAPLARECPQPQPSPMPVPPPTAAPAAIASGYAQSCVESCLSSTCQRMRAAAAQHPQDLAAGTLAAGCPDAQVRMSCTQQCPRDLPGTTVPASGLGPSPIRLPPQPSTLPGPPPPVPLAAPTGSVQPH